MKTKRRKATDAPVSEADIDPVLIEYIRESRYRYRVQTLNDFVGAAVTYDGEMRRDDLTHRARARQREGDLRLMIEYAYDGMHPGPITQRDVESAKLAMDIQAGKSAKRAK